MTQGVDGPERGGPVGRVEAEEEPDDDDGDSESESNGRKLCDRLDKVTVLALPTGQLRRWGGVILLAAYPVFVGTALL